jgi:hypothetical protein
VRGSWQQRPRNNSIAMRFHEHAEHPDPDAGSSLQSAPTVDQVQSHSNSSDTRFRITHSYPIEIILGQNDKRGRCSIAESNPGRMERSRTALSSGERLWHYDMLRQSRCAWCYFDNMIISLYSRYHKSDPDPVQERPRCTSCQQWTPCPESELYWDFMRQYVVEQLMDMDEWRGDQL